MFSLDSMFEYCSGKSPTFSGKALNGLTFPQNKQYDDIGNFLTKICRKSQFFSSYLQGLVNSRDLVH